MFEFWDNFLHKQDTFVGVILITLIWAGMFYISLVKKD